MYKATALVFALIACAVMSPAANAQSPEAQVGWSVGVLAGATASPFDGEDTDIFGVPLITYRTGRWSLGSSGVSYDFIRSDRLTIQAGATPRFSPLSNVDAAELNGIDRQITADAFLSANVALSPSLSLDAALRQEVTGEHNGQELAVSLGYGARFGRLGVTASAGANWQSSGLAEYQWGVFASEATPTRAAFDPGAVVIPELSVEAAYSLDGDWTAIGSIRSEFLPDAVTDSPIVEDDLSVSIGLGLIRRF